MLNSAEQATMHKNKAARAMMCSISQARPPNCSTQRARGAGRSRGFVPMTESMTKPTRAGERKEKQTLRAMAATQPAKVFQLPRIRSQIKRPLVVGTGRFLGWSCMPWASFHAADPSGGSQYPHCNTLAGRLSPARAGQGRALLSGTAFGLQGAQFTGHIAGQIG